MYTVGSVVHLTATFKDSDGTLVDPASVSVAVTKPDGTAAVGSPFAAAHDSTGLYHYDYTTTVAGLHQWYFIGAAGAVQLPDVFTVAPLTTGALISIADAKKQLHKSASGDDDEIRGYIQSATEIINRKCGYTVATTFTETVPPSVDGHGHRVLMLSRTPVLSVASVTSRMQGMPAVDIGTLNINNEAGVIYLANWFQWFGPQLVTYTAGRTFVPPALQTACALIVAYLWETQRGGATAVPGLAGDQVEAMLGDPSFPPRALALMRMAPYDAAPGIA